jgi:spermidine/putrescine transport system ATP-binding protein
VLVAGALAVGASEPHDRTATTAAATASSAANHLRRLRIMRDLSPMHTMRPPMESPAVELRAVSRRIGGHTVLDRVDLSVLRGEFFSLLGPSGCGKTTSLRLVAGFDEPDEGAVLVDGADMAGVPPYRRDVNTVFQSYALFPHLTVAGNVAFGLEMQAVPRAEISARVAEALALVQLAGLGERRPHQLSGGQQQRVALARAIVRRPKVLLLDEPLGALDLKLRRGMQLELKRLQRRLGTTFVYVTHDQEEALTMSDRIAVMDRGRVLQVGSPHDVYERPATRFVADFLGEANLLDGEAVDGGVRIAGSLVPVASRGNAAAGRVTLCVRPERVELTTSGNGLAGVVEEAVYAGSEVKYVVRLADGQSLAVRAPAGAARAAGERVVATFAAEHARLLEPRA